MAGRVKADCGANLTKRSYALNGARFALAARGIHLQPLVTQALPERRLRLEGCSRKRMFMMMHCGLAILASLAPIAAHAQKSVG